MCRSESWVDGSYGCFVVCCEDVRCGFGGLVDQFLIRLEAVDTVGVGDVVVSFRSVGVIPLRWFRVDSSTVGSDGVYMSVC